MHHAVEACDPTIATVDWAARRSPSGLDPRGPFEPRPYELQVRAGGEQRDDEDGSGGAEGSDDERGDSGAEEQASGSDTRVADSTDVGADDGRGGEEIDEGTAKRPPASVAWDVVPYCRAVLTITIGRVMNDWHDGGWGPGAWVAMGLMMLVFWGLVAAVVVYVIRNVGHRPDSHAGGDRPRQDQALQILDERFARGEIDADDYRARRDLLRSS